MANALDRLTIKGFKSIRSLEDFELKALNVLIGGNGAGKSNFIEIFRMLQAMVGQNFATFILGGGGASDFLFNGPKETKNIEASFHFGRNDYAFELEPTVDEKFLITTEKQKYDLGSWKYISSGTFESRLNGIKEEQSGLWPGVPGVGHYVYQAVSNWTVYHFHDTSKTAAMRKPEIVEDFARLRSEASNIAPFLHALRSNNSTAYEQIVETVRLVTPFFDDFLLRSKFFGEKEKVNLSWKQKGSDYPMQPYHLSDGTIRFICLATALLQPDPPTTILIDEPELGLHPYAIEILAELIQVAARRTQVVVSTQSPALVDYFSPEAVIVVNRDDGASTFQRLDAESLAGWLEDYSLGDLWRKNIVDGGPVHE